MQVNDQLLTGRLRIDYGAPRVVGAVRRDGVEPDREQSDISGKTSRYMEQSSQRSSSCGGCGGTSVIGC